mgnify:FL=1
MIALDIKMYSTGGLGVFVFPSLIGSDGSLLKLSLRFLLLSLAVFLAFLIQLFVRVPNL